MLEYCKASVDAKSEECYKLFCCMNTFDEHKTLDNLFENSIASRRTSGKIDSCEALF